MAVLVQLVKRMVSVRCFSGDWCFHSQSDVTRSNFRVKFSLWLELMIDGTLHPRQDSKHNQQRHKANRLVETDDAWNWADVDGGLGCGAHGLNSKC